MRRIIIIEQSNIISRFRLAYSPSMQSKHASITSLLLVISLHAGVLAAVAMTPSTPKPIEVVTPSIQGAIVMAAPEEPPPPPLEPPPPPPPEPQPAPKPKPLPKAPPSERAVKAPEPPPPPPPVEPMQQPQPEPQPAPVVPPNADASELNNPAPAYPNLSRRLGEKGTVTLEILVRANGTVGEVKIKRSTGHKRLDGAALNAIKRWRFIPASQAGVAIDYWYEIDFEFGLR